MLKDAREQWRTRLESRNLMKDERLMQTLRPRTGQTGDCKFAAWHLFSSFQIIRCVNNFSAS